MNLDGRTSGEELRGVERRETVNSIYKIFSIKEKANSPRNNKERK